MGQSDKKQIDRNGHGENGGNPVQHRDETESEMTRKRRNRCKSNRLTWRRQYSENEVDDVL